MNGRTHAVLGAASISGAALAIATPQQAMVMMTIAGGFALGPDIDHPSATISKSMPTIVHKGVHSMAKAVRLATSSGLDRSDAAHRAMKGHDPDHRGVTHTLLPIALVAAGVWVIGLLPWGVVVLTAVSAWWCRRLWRGLWPFLVALVIIAALGAVPAPMVALAAGVGWLSHLVADACTKAGAPLFWPLKIKGKRFYRIRLLGSSMASGNQMEWLIAGALATMMNFPVFLL